MGRLERHLDLETIARVKAGIKHKHEPMRRVSEPREASTYRGARRNACFRPTDPEGKSGMWAGIKPTARFYRGPVLLNRSQEWPSIKSYAASPMRKHVGGYAG